jgi:hypothetical protein
MPHYGHVGVIQAARELSMELDNLAEDEDDVMAITDCPPNKSLEGFPLSPLLKLDYPCSVELCNPCTCGAMVEFCVEADWPHSPRRIMPCLLTSRQSAF